MKRFGDKFGEQYGDNEPKKLSWGIERMLSTMKAPTPDVLSAVFLRWPEIVGEELGNHTQPSGIQDSPKGQILVIEADNPAYASQAKWQEADVIRKVREAAKNSKISAVAIRVRPR